MNIVKAFLFQHELCIYRVVVVWELADIEMMNDDPDYIFIGTVDYDTEKKRYLMMLEDVYIKDLKYAFLLEYAKYLKRSVVIAGSHFSFLR